MERRVRLIAAAAALLVALVAVVGILWFASTITGDDVDRVEEAAASPPSAGAPTPAVSETPVRAAALPPAEAPAAGDDELPDELVRVMVSSLSSHPRLAAWLVGDELLRRFVGAVQAIAGGYSPHDQVGDMRPRQPFVVRHDATGLLVIADGSFRRYDLAAEVVASIDARGAVELFREISPRLDRIHRETSWSDAAFEDVLRAAVDHLLEVSPPAGQLAVERRLTSFSFADDELESLSGAQRQLMRMGGANARIVQAKLAELHDAFGWPEPQWTGPTEHVPEAETSAVASNDDESARWSAEASRVPVALAQAAAAR